MSERNPAHRALAGLLKGVVKAYAGLISPLMGPKCRFYPTCSAYACQAFDRHGALPGLWLTIRRVGTCHPWSGRQGIDPVPDQFEWRAQFGYKRDTPNTACKCKDETLNP